MSDSATGMLRIPPMLKDEASALHYAARMAYDDSVTPPIREAGVPETTAYDAWVITADSSMPEAGFGMSVRYFVAPNITSGYWKNRGATHIRRFDIPKAEQEIRDPNINYTKPEGPPPPPFRITSPDAMEALKTALLLAVKAVECLEHPAPPAPTVQSDVITEGRDERVRHVDCEGAEMPLGLPEAPPPNDSAKSDIFNPSLDNPESPG